MSSWGHGHGSSSGSAHWDPAHSAPAPAWDAWGEEEDWHHAAHLPHHAAHPPEEYSWGWGDEEAWGSHHAAGGMGKGKRSSHPATAPEYSGGGKAPPRPPCSKGVYRTPVTASYAGAQPDGYATGYHDGTDVAYDKGYAAGHRKGWHKGYAEGVWTTSGGSRRNDEDWEESEAGGSAAGSGKNKNKKKKSGAYSKWFKEYMEADPTDVSLFPRFQCWLDNDWGEYQEKANTELRGQCVAPDSNDIHADGMTIVDMGNWEGQECKYEVCVFQNPKGNAKVREALAQVKHHKHWSKKYEADVVGYQQDISEKDENAMEDDEKKEKKPRPVRILRGPMTAEAPPGPFQ